MCSFFEHIVFFLFQGTFFTAPFIILNRLQHIKRRTDDLIHIVITILTEASAKNDILFPVRQLLILCVQLIVLVVVDGIIRLIAGIPFG